MSEFDETLEYAYQMLAEEELLIKMNPENRYRPYVCIGMNRIIRLIERQKEKYK